MLLNVEQRELRRHGIFGAMNEPHERPAIRVGDAERENTVNELSLAMTRGQLDYAEYDERAKAARAAKFRHELAPLTADLIAPEDDSAAIPNQYRPASLTTMSPAEAMVTNEPGGNGFSLALMSGTELNGDWRVASTHRSIAVMGGTSLDLSNARLSSSHITINATAIMGGIEIIVPEDVRVSAVGLPLMGGFGLSDGKGVTMSQAELPANAPTIVVRGLALMGGVAVTRVPRGRVRRTS